MPLGKLGKYIVLMMMVFVMERDEAPCTSKTQEDTVVGGALFILEILSSGARFALAES